jgi:hypothetical protein
LASLVREHTLFGVVAAISVKDYDKLFPADAKNLLPHPYYVAFLPFISLVLEGVRERRVPHERISFVLGHSTEFSNFAKKLFYLVKEREDKEHWLGDVGFGSPDEHIELQVADLLVQTTRRKSYYMLQEFTAKRRPKTNAQDRAFGLGKHVLLTLDDAAGLQKKIKAVETLGLEWKW